jgi:hypothetical protein
MTVFSQALTVDDQGLSNYAYFIDAHCTDTHTHSSVFQTIMFFYKKKN